MKNIIKTTAYSAVAVTSVAYTNLNELAANTTAWDLYGTENAKQYWDGTSDGDIMSTLQSILTYILGFLAFVATAYAIYGWFQILTAGWDEEKVKKWKTTLINALIGVFVILIAWTLVNWVLSAWATTI